MNLNRIVLIFIFCFHLFYIKGQDIYTFPIGQEPLYENSDYTVWIKSLINEKGYLFVNLTIKAKKQFCHYNYGRLKKSDRTDILSPKDLKLISKDIKGDKQIHNYVGLDHEGEGHSGRPTKYFKQEYSWFIDKNKSRNITLCFRGNLSGEENMISILHNNPSRYFNFVDIPISFPKHKEWDIDNLEEKLIQLSESSGDPVCGIYIISDLRFACIPHDNEFILICLDSAKDYSWGPGDIKAKFYKTNNPFFFKGIEFIQESYGYFESESNILLDGTVLEVKSVEQDRKGKPYHESTFYKITPSIKNNSKNNPLKWSGTGFALHNGYIVTNNHVADEATDIEIFGINGDFTKGYKAKVIGKDKVSDIALLQIEDPSIITLWSDPPYSVNFTMADVGEGVFALGYPLIGTMGEEVKLTNGIISSRSGFEGDVTNYQISVPIQPGNSGGPMFNENGELVGIICAKHEGTENVGYAIKTSYLKNLIESVTNTNIIPSNNTLKGKTLKDQVKAIRDNVFLIKCSK